MKIRQIKFSESYKRKLVTEYLTSDLSQRELMSKYGIKGHNTLSRWVKQYEPITFDTTSSKYDTLPVMKEKNTAEDFKKLTKRVTELEKALEEAELRAIAYQKLVENAEKELGFPLPKKFSTKQSRS